MENTNTKVAFPMHMWGDFSLCKTFKSSEYAKDYKDRVIEISKDNQVFDI